MKRVILDTSVYGKLVEEPEIADMLFKKLSKELVIYGTDVIKNELRNTPKSLFYKNKNLRNLLLSSYRTFVRKRHHYLQYNKLIETLLNDYLKEFRRRGGNTTDRKLRNDMIIIATATIYKLDIVVSHDENTMLSPVAVVTYRTINKRYGMPDPAFKTYRAFKEELISNQEERPV